MDRKEKKWEQINILVPVFCDHLKFTQADLIEFSLHAFPSWEASNMTVTGFCVVAVLFFIDTKL